MRRSLLILAVSAIGMAAAACTSAAPGWTYAPPTPAPAVTPAPSGQPTAGPATAAPSSDASVVAVSALNIAFEQTAATAPANTAFVISFDNKDAGIPHNVAIHDSMNMEKFKGDLVTGPGQVQYKVDPLPAGEYTFVCSVHPNMTGKLTVGP